MVKALADLSFLLVASNYTPEKMLTRFPFNDLYEERALLLSRIGRHEQALIIYAHKLHDERMAEEYCARHYNPDTEEARDVYLALLKVYLRPAEDSVASSPASQPQQQTVKVGPALALLNKHFKEIDAPKVSLQLPPSPQISKPTVLTRACAHTHARTHTHTQSSFLTALCLFSRSPGAGAAAAQHVG